MKPSEFRTRVQLGAGCIDRQVPLNDQFLAWLFHEQSKDEACLLLGKEMDKYAKGLQKKDLKKNEVESHIRGYWLMEQKDQGVNLKREAKINPRKGREQIRTQVKNYQCFKRLYDHV